MPFLTTTIAAELGHNTSANSAYDRTNFAANFTGTTWVAASTPASVNSALVDDSWNPITPAHVSPQSVKSLKPALAGLEWFAHLTPWFHSGGGGGHIDIGVNCNSNAWCDAAITDIEARGFDGIIIDWHGSANYIETVTQRLVGRLATLGSSLTFEIMMDPGAYTNLSTLQTQLAYVETNYLGNSRYKLIGGLPRISFFSTVSGVSNSDYATAKSGMGVSTFWMREGASQLSNSYVNSCFDWDHGDDSGVNPLDPYKLVDLNNFLSTVHSNAKSSMLFLSWGFDGYLTAIPPPGWSKGKYVPQDAGKCYLDTLAALAANVPTHCAGVQVVWNDYEEGDQIETSIDNALTVHASLSGSIVTYSVSGGTGDESTLSAYRLLATPDGINAAVLANITPTGAGGTFDLSTVTGWTGGIPYTIFTIAVGKANIRSQFDSGLTYTPSGATGNHRNTQTTGHTGQTPSSLARVTGAGAHLGQTPNSKVRTTQAAEHVGQTPDSKVRVTGTGVQLSQASPSIARTTQTSAAISAAPSGLARTTFTSLHLSIPATPSVVTANSVNVFVST